MQTYNLPHSATPIPDIRFEIYPVEYDPFIIPRPGLPSEICRCSVTGFTDDDVISRWKIKREWTAPGRKKRNKPTSHIADRHSVIKNE